jgi:hypothetical protein
MKPVIFNNLEQIRSLSSKHFVETMHLFGSQASGDVSDKSDIDLLVKFSDKLDVLNYADNYFDLLEKLERLLECKVDLVSEKSLKNPILISEIDKSKVQLL